MKKKTTQLNSNTIWMVSHISAFLGEGMSTSTETQVFWSTDQGEVILDTENKEIKFVDSTLSDLKTYFAIVGIASSYGYTTGDYFTSND